MIYYVYEASLFYGQHQPIMYDPKAEILGSGSQSWYIDISISISKCSLQYMMQA